MLYKYAAREFRFNLLTPYTAELYAASATPPSPHELRARRVCAFRCRSGLSGFCLANYTVTASREL